METERTVADIMTPDPVTLFEEENLFQVRAKLSAHSFHHIPVVDGTKLVGMLSQRDIVRLTVAGVDSGALATAREARFLEATFVRDIMQAPVVTARPHDSIRDAARRMLTNRIGALPVVDDNNVLLGIVTENDLVRQIAEHDL